MMLVVSFNACFCTNRGIKWMTNSVQPAGVTKKTTGAEVVESCTGNAHCGKEVKQNNPLS